MDKLRGFSGNYSVGLDMGTGSVGWAAVDGEGGLLRAPGGKPAWGSRLFPSAETAAVARAPRGQRRRYVRRRWRLDLLQGIFKDAIEEVDPEFYIRLRQSRLLKEDRIEEHREYRWPLFNDRDFTERDYYQKFPTIYHLRRWLMETDEKADVRLIYLACHNIVKHRGNFLREGQSITAKVAKPDDAVERFLEALNDWCFERGWACSENKTRVILDTLADETAAASDKKKAIAAVLGVSSGGVGDHAADKRLNDALAGAMVGLKAEFKNVFGELGVDQTNIYLSNDEAVDALREACPDDGVELFDRLCDVYSAYVLQGLLSHAPGETISANMIARYEKYGQDLALLKQLVREYAPEKYNGFFRGAFYGGTSIYDSGRARGYTKYDLGQSKLPYEDFKKEVEKLFAKTGAPDDLRYQEMIADFGRHNFLRRLKTSDNGSIYYQLHLEELDAIIENQKRFYPFLGEQKDKIESLVTFRIPYYVGPLTQRNARLDAHGKARFAWSERREGMEDTPITPWNWDEVIDRDKSAEKFITRMTGECTYLKGEDVLPKCSLLYEEFCVLNELNGARWSVDGDDWRRFDAAEREGIVNDLFSKRRSVSYKAVAQWMEREEHFANVHVRGGQGENDFESKLGSYVFFCKDVFHADCIDEADYPMVEDLILWNTLFEDRKILRRRIEQTYGDRLTPDQITTVCKKRLTGWGRLSRRFLTGLKVSADCGRVSIMDVLREGNPNEGQRSRSMVMMEVLRDEDLGFQKAVDEFNRQYFAENTQSLGVNDLPGSPAIRRSLNQALRIVDEIAHTAGKAPANIFIEVTRDDGEKKRGQRTKRRYEELKAALSAFEKEDPEIWQEIQAASPSDFDERLTLYFMQRGKCLYSGRPIDINQLSNAGLYEVDHIIPRAYIKDDSLENKALVYREENQTKTDALLLPSAMRKKMGDYWRMLHGAGLIGDKKFSNLMRDHIDEKAMKGFVARQLVETSQTVKLVQQLLRVRYPQTRIVPVKASLSHGLRESAGFIKVREANDFHHAHDAYLACRMGQFIQMRFPYVYENPIGLAHVVRNYVSEASAEFKRSHTLPGGSGFIVNSFMKSGFDKETGEVFRDTWDAEAEIEDIRHVLNFRQCFISRMPEEDSGAFWDATIYSPRTGKSLALPLKEGLAPEKYGSYSREQFAYFFVYEARNPKRGKREFRFAQVPVRLAAQIAHGEHALERYASELAKGEGLEFVRIERSRILRRQLMEINGDRLLVTGKQEARNARELAFTQEELGWFETVQAYPKGCSEEDCLTAAHALLRSILRRGETMGKRLWNGLKMHEKNDELLSLDAEETKRLALGLCAIVNAANNVVDTRCVGGSQHAGKIQPTYNKLLNDPNVDFYIIDQSVTGMFERRTRIGL